MKQLPQVLLVDDNPADVVLAREALAGGKHQSRISNVEDGEEALAFLHRIGRHADAVRPVLAILDLNLPKKDGRAVLAEAKADKTLRETRPGSAALRGGGDYFLYTVGSGPFSSV